MTTRKMRHLVDELTAAPVDDKEGGTRPNHFERRTKAIEQANETEAALQVRVTPDRCRIWGGNARAYEELNYERCSGLISALISQGKQEIPAIGRRVRDDPVHDFEIIAGARRHWAVSWLRENGYPDFKYFVEVRDIETDEAAFRIADIENRDREDVSPYERAVEYANALHTYYDGDRERMAHRLEIGKSTLSRYMMLAELPAEVLAAFPDTLSVSLNHAQRLNPLLRDKSKRENILAEAKRLNEEHETARSEGRATLSSLDVLRRLEKAVRQGPSSRARKAKALPNYRTSDGELIMRVETAGAKGFRVYVPANNAASEDDFVKSCRAFYREMINKEQ